MNSLPPGPLEDPIQEAEPKFETSSIRVDFEILAVSLVECQMSGLTAQGMARITKVLGQKGYFASTSPGNSSNFAESFVR